LSDPDDQRDATSYPSRGGGESQDWEVLLACTPLVGGVDSVRLLDRQRGEEAGIKSATSDHR
jgi:protein subunit release factor B